MREHEFLSQPKNILSHLMSRGLTHFFYYPHLFFEKKLYTLRPNIYLFLLFINMYTFYVYIYNHYILYQTDTKKPTTIRRTVVRETCVFQHRGGPIKAPLLKLF